MRPPLSGWRLVAATWIPVAMLAGLWYVQRYETSPGEVTFVEFRLMLLAGGILLPIILCARWIDAAPRKVEPRKERRR
jgi:hypothetical protein